MGATRPLSGAFLRARAEPSSEIVDEDALERALADAVARARAAWPELPLAGERFAAFLGERVSPDGIELAPLEDLWAACACDVRLDEADTGASARARAVAAVEARYFPDVEAALRKMGAHASRIDELKQMLRHHLFVGDPATGTPPRIADYRGTGDLRGWLRVTATRAALKLIRRDSRDVPADDVLLEASAAQDDPELSYMKQAYRAAFKEAFQEALESLSPRERLLLKQQVVDGLSIDELGALYQAHRATAARWLSSAREKLLSRTKRIFMMHARISAEECESIMRLVRSQLDVSIHRRLSGAA